MSRAAIVLLAFVLSACGAGDTSATSGTTSGGARCTPGIQQACPCAGGGDGFQTCADDGSSFDTCHACEPMGTGGAVSSSASSGSGGGGCGVDEKSCPLGCAPLSSPDTGCGDNSCLPCGYPHASAVCIGGHCAMGVCDQGYGDCDGMASGGCETSISTAFNCGTCGNHCASGEVCAGGACSQCGDEINTSLPFDPAQTMCGSYFALAYISTVTEVVSAVEIPVVVPTVGSAATTITGINKDVFGAPGSQIVQMKTQPGAPPGWTRSVPWNMATSMPTTYTLTKGVRVWIQVDANDCAAGEKVANGGAGATVYKTTPMLTWIPYGGVNVVMRVITLCP